MAGKKQFKFTAFACYSSLSLIFIKIMIEKWGGFVPTSGIIPPTSGYFRCLSWDPHMGYVHEAVGFPAVLRDRSLITRRRVGYKLGKSWV